MFNLHPSDKNRDTAIYCPLTQGPAKKLKSLSADFIRAQTEMYFSSKIPSNISFSAYDIYRASSSGFEFASPALPGSSCYYDWLSKQPGYYEEWRWEQNILLYQLMKLSKKTALLDVGCGNGEFLRRVGKNHNINIRGIDLSESAVNYCNQNGTPALKCTIEELCASNAGAENLFDVITSFHCLEHVPAPKDFVYNCMSLLKEDGELYISTPCSPKTIEVNWYDPQNHPPHHMTRWTPKAYLELGNCLGLSTTIRTRPPKSTIATVIRAYRYSVYGRAKVSRSELTSSLLTNPRVLLAINIKLRERSKFLGGRWGDTLLVQYRRQPSSLKKPKWFALKRS